MTVLLGSGERSEVRPNWGTENTAWEARSDPITPIFSGSRPPQCDLVFSTHTLPPWWTEPSENVSCNKSFIHSTSIRSQLHKSSYYIHALGIYLWPSGTPPGHSCPAYPFSLACPDVLIQTLWHDFGLGLPASRSHSPLERTPLSFPSFWLGCLLTVFILSAV